MTNPESTQFVIGALRAALPYLRMYRGKTFVVKIGGAVCGEPHALERLVEELGVLRECGIQIVLVHGAGPQTTALAGRLGVPTEIVAGRRVTCQKTLDAAVMTMNGTANTAVLSACRAVNVPAIGISGVDGGCIKAHRRAPKKMHLDGKDEVVDFGHVGDIDSIDAGVFTTLLGAGYMPVVSPIAADDRGNLLNINADTVAARIARTIGAAKVIFMTEAPGILEDRRDPASLVSSIDIEGLDRLVARGVIDAGMLPKVEAVKDAIQGGIPRVHVISDKKPHALLLELFTNSGCGTLVVRRLADLEPAEVVAHPLDLSAETSAK